MADTTKCKRGCVYWSPTTRTCDYLILTDKRRPCPPGKDCTAYSRRKRQAKKQP